MKEDQPGRRDYIELISFSFVVISKYLSFSIPGFHSPPNSVPSILFNSSITECKHPVLSVKGIEPNRSTERGNVERSGSRLWWLYGTQRQPRGRNQGMYLCWEIVLGWNVGIFNKEFSMNTKVQRLQNKYPWFLHWKFRDYKINTHGFYTESSEITK